MLYGILWDIPPEKIPEAMKRYEQGKIKAPEGLKVIEEYFWGSHALEVIETDTPILLMVYAGQFNEFARSYQFFALIKGSDLLPH